MDTDGRRPGHPIELSSPIEFPEDFPERLRRLKEATGLSWNGFAQAIGADPRQVARWRKGVEPAGAAMIALFALARRTRGGIEVLLRSDAHMIGLSQRTLPDY